MQNLFTVARKAERKEKWIDGYPSSKRTRLKQFERCAKSVWGEENPLTLLRGVFQKNVPYLRSDSVPIRIGSQSLRPGERRRGKL
jgi:hypothetical protein